MYAGISTACMYPMLTEDSLSLLASHKVGAVEIFINSIDELGAPMLKEFKQVADSNGVRIVSLHPYGAPMDTINFFTGYERRFHEGMDIYRKYYEAANYLGAELVVFHGAAKAFPIEYAEYFERFAVLVDDAISCGSCLCHENVSRCIGHSSRFFAEMRAAIPQAKFVFDTKQALRANEDIIAFAKCMGDRIKHVHLSDNDDTHSCLPPGYGTFNILELLDTIANNGFNEGVIVELYRENFSDIVELIDGYQHLCAQISTLRKNAETDAEFRQAQAK